MGKTIAISGKGGSGKTTLCAIMVRALLEKAERSVLAIDADPNSCLGLTLGTEVTGTIAQLREQKQPANEGMDRVRAFEYGLQQAITEAKGFDLLTMGQPEGPSCYCAVNNLLRKFMDDLSRAYEFVIIDNEAGMEHLSRRTTNNVDLLCIVAEATPIGKTTAQRISALAKKLPITVKQTGLIWNRTDTPIQLDGIENLGLVPFDQDVAEASMQGASIFDIEESCPAIVAVQKILEKKLNFKLV
jgi:CO dehydrogenase maturation factor